MSEDSRHPLHPSYLAGVGKAPKSVLSPSASPVAEASDTSSPVPLNSPESLELQEIPAFPAHGAVPVRQSKPGEPETPLEPLVAEQERPTMPFAALVVEPSAPAVIGDPVIGDPVVAPPALADAEPVQQDAVQQNDAPQIAVPQIAVPQDAVPQDADEIMELASEWQEETPSAPAHDAPASNDVDTTPSSSPWPRILPDSGQLSVPSDNTQPSVRSEYDQPPASAGGGGEPPVPGGNNASDDDPNNENGESSDEPPMTLMEHLGELRTRLLRCLIGACIGFFLCYGIADRLFNWLALPLAAVMPQDTRLIYTSVPEGFFVYLKVAFVAGIFVASPYIFYQIWAFVAPGLYKEERRMVLPLSVCSALFFLMGASFCYFVVFPYAFEFFMSYSTGIIVAMPSINEYLGFSLKMLIAFGLIFEMPLFAFFLARLGIITATWMRKVRRYAVLAVFVVAAVLTPPDVFSQMLMAVPMLLLYELSIFVAAAAGRKPKPAEATSDPASDPASAPSAKDAA